MIIAVIYAPDKHVGLNGSLNFLSGAYITAMIIHLFILSTAASNVWILIYSVSYHHSRLPWPPARLMPEERYAVDWKGLFIQKDR